MMQACIVVSIWTTYVKEGAPSCPTPGRSVPVRSALPSLGWVLLTLGSVVLTVSVLMGGREPPSGDFVMIVWEPARQILGQG